MRDRESALERLGRLSQADASGISRTLVTGVPSSSSLSSCQVNAEEASQTASGDTKNRITGQVLNQIGHCDRSPQPPLASENGRSPICTDRTRISEYRTPTGEAVPQRADERPIRAATLETSRSKPTSGNESPTFETLLLNMPIIEFSDSD